MKNDLLDDLRIAAPCSVPWESMNGTERVRHCSQCALNVYDISQLTRSEAHALITTTEGRLCLRLHRRLDGTVLTRDCPVGLRALRRRVTRRASAVLTALLSFTAAVFAQDRPQAKQSCDNRTLIKTEKQKSPDQQLSISGVVRDAAGTAVGGATVTLTVLSANEKRTATSNDAGEFQFVDLPSGEYKLEIVRLGFSASVSTLLLKTGELLRVETTLASELIVLSGVVDLPLMKEKPIYENGTMRLSGDLIQRLPH